MPAPAFSSPDTDRLAAITGREREILTLVGRGLANPEIATELVLSPATVKTYITRLLTKLAARDRVQLVILAYESGLVPLTAAPRRTGGNNGSVPRRESCGVCRSCRACGVSVHGVGHVVDGALDVGLGDLGDISPPLLVLADLDGAEQVVAGDGVVVRVTYPPTCPAESSFPQVDPLPRRRIRHVPAHSPGPEPALHQIGATDSPGGSPGAVRYSGGAAFRSPSGGVAPPAGNSRIDHRTWLGP